MDKARKEGSDPEETGLYRDLEEQAEIMAQMKLKGYHENRIHVALMLQKGLSFVNKWGQPLQMMRPLKLDPDLLERPVYH